jgi:hypothetical protein
VITRDALEMTESVRLSSLKAMLKAEIACFRAKGAEVVRRQGLGLVGGEMEASSDSAGRTAGVRLSYFDGTRRRNSSSQFSTSTSSFGRAGGAAGR